MSKSNGVVINGVKCGKYGLRFGGKYCPVWYSHGKLIDGTVCVTIYAKHYGDQIPSEIGSVQNGTEIQTDYHEKDKVRFNAGTPEYNALLTLCN